MDGNEFTKLELIFTNIRIQQLTILKVNNNEISTFDLAILHGSETNLHTLELRNNLLDDPDAHVPTSLKSVPTLKVLVLGGWIKIKQD